VRPLPGGSTAPPGLFEGEKISHPVVGGGVIFGCFFAWVGLSSFCGGAFLFSPGLNLKSSHEARRYYLLDCLTYEITPVGSCT